MNFSHDGLSLWYGTPDAPAPGDAGVVPRGGASLIVAVRPISPANTVTVRYRVDGGREQRLYAREHKTDYAANSHYFIAKFPELRGGLVEYLPVLGSAGRQVPAPQLARHYPSSFRVAPPEASAPAYGQRTAVASARPLRSPDQRHFEAGLDFVAAVALEFDPPQYLGDTPAGARVNFFVRGGTVEGDDFKASVMENSSDHLLVRRDGVGVVRIRAAFATSDGARLDVEAGGYVDFGPNGHRLACIGELPDRAPIVITPLITTQAYRYKALARVQCIGVGYTNLAVNKACYYVYRASSLPSK